MDTNHSPATNNFGRETTMKNTTKTAGPELVETLRELVEFANWRIEHPVLSRSRFVPKGLASDAETDLEKYELLLDAALVFVQGSTFSIAEFCHESANYLYEAAELVGLHKLALLADDEIRTAGEQAELIDAEHGRNEFGSRWLTTRGETELEDLTSDIRSKVVATIDAELDAMSKIGMVTAEPHQTTETVKALRAAERVATRIAEQIR
jgi:hypothetical protein